ncbi:hypothetical protein HK100_012684 [Physocladia obscura]|uniref:BAR domain-containing protein n=1 Tax=Physocladia obscura TaxID=109957 RepID=A0AAD5T5D5_9FUNG|nr:hypothetical protein HK100_012684 [Physocladia obscura]
MATGLRAKSSVQNFREVANAAAERLKPLGNSAAQRFSMATQYAREKMNSANTDVTELPPKYRELEEKVDRIKAQHEAFLRLSGNYKRAHYDYVPVFSETAKDVVSTVSAGWTQLLTGSAPKESDHSTDVPPSLAHAFARAARSSIGHDSQEPMAVALSKFANTQEAVGDARQRMDAQIIARFHDPTTVALATTITAAIKARRHVAAARLTYDAARTKMKTINRSGNISNEEAVRVEMEAAEDQFVAAVDDAMAKMSLVIESTEPLKNLAELVAAQAKYYKEAYEAFAALTPEIDELQVTSEALSNSA